MESACNRHAELQIHTVLSDMHIHLKRSKNVRPYLITRAMVLSNILAVSKLQARQSKYKHYCFNKYNLCECDCRDAVPAGPKHVIYFLLCVRNDLFYNYSNLNIGGYFRYINTVLVYKLQYFYFCL